MYYFTSDTHFGHNKIIEYCKRPFKDSEEMNETIIKNWNEIVKLEDTVFHLGDFAYKGKVKEFKERLNGHIIHIKGNHDQSSKQYSIIRELIIRHGGFKWKLIHDPADAYTYNHVLCGHVHEHWKIRERNGSLFINVGVDVWDFKPITMKQILKSITIYNKENKVI